MIPLLWCAQKYVVVIGLGKAGQATIRALVAGGATVIAWDDKPEARQLPETENVTLVPPESIDFTRVQLLVMSPGVPLTHQAAAKARQANCPIIGDVELLFRQYPTHRYVGITGTNGKSTVTELVGHLLRAGGVKVQLGGNLGIPAVGLEPPAADTVFVLEMSSYQLELVDQTRFEIAVLLNFSVDHQERHGSMPAYVAAKQRIFRHQQGNDLAIIGWDDGYSRAVLTQMQSKHPARVAGIGQRAAALQGITRVEAEGSTLIVMAGDAEAMRFDLTHAPSLQGPHNAQNAAAAVAVALSFHINAEIIQAALQSYQGLAHRMEKVAEKNGVVFVNDSKATNADAAEQALKSYHTIYWIAGGKPKEGDRLNPDIIRTHVTKAYLIGEAEEIFARQLEGVVPYVRCGTLAQAFAAASEEAKTGVVLLSPACASFDQWKNFEERGDAFRALARGVA